ncbi:MAG: Trp biosynthesis-associated membrane protein [Micrococcus sp.]|nr:Trp biosynthesis-associated membrane protein [Micrococcus sp.]
MTTHPESRRPRTAIRRRSVVLLALAAGLLALLSSGQTWVSATGLTTGSVTEIHAAGAQAAPVLSAMGAVTLAAGLALSIVRTLGRWIVGVILLAAGVVVVGSAITAALDPGAAAARAVAQGTGTTAEAGAYMVSVWPWVAVFAGVVAALAALAALVLGRGWTTSRRYDSPAAPATATAAAPAEHLDEMDAWDELSRGQDPTRDPADDTAQDRAPR